MRFLLKAVILCTFSVCVLCRASFEPLQTHGDDFENIISLDRKIHQQISEFDRWAAQQGREYTEEELSERKASFEANRKMIEEHNSMSEKWFEMEINDYVDMDHEEFTR